MTYDNTDKGVLFPNKDRKSENHPHYTGRINFGGYDHRLAGWVTTDENGRLKFIKLQVSELREKKDDIVDNNIGDGPVSLDDIPF